MKKKLSILFIFLLFIFTYYQIESLAVTANEIVDSVPFQDGTNTKFGRITRKSYTYNVTSKVVYHSFWAPWQSDLYEDFQDFVFDLYECEYYFDVPVKIIESFRLEAGGTKTVTYSEKESYTVVQSQAWKQSLTVYTSFQNEFDYYLGVADPFVTLGVSNNSSFKVTDEYLSANSYNSSREFKQEIEKNYTEIYENNRNTYVYVQRNLRQKFKVLIGYTYKTNYEQKRKGSGAFGKDSNYSYDILNYTCQSIHIFLIPVEEVYYHISYYIDNEKGQKVFDNQGHPSILFA